MAPKTDYVASSISFLTKMWLLSPCRFSNKSASTIDFMKYCTSENENVQTYKRKIELLLTAHRQNCGHPPNRQRYGYMPHRQKCSLCTQIKCCYLFMNKYVVICTHRNVVICSQTEVWSNMWSSAHRQKGESFAHRQKCGYLPHCSVSVLGLRFHKMQCNI